MEHLTSAIDAIFKVTALSSMILVLLILLVDFAANQVIIEPLLVPGKFAQAGYTAEILARRMQEQIIAIRSEVRNYQDVENLGKILPPVPEPTLDKLRIQISQCLDLG
jgi:hypothetical protein